MTQSPPRIHFGVDESTIPNRKSYLEEIDSEPFSSVFYKDGRSATLEVEGLVGKGCFPFPKNSDVLAELIQLVTLPDDLVVDFFAGSGSTGHAVFRTNSEGGSNRRFILIQLPEPTRIKSGDGTWEESAAWKAGYKTIAEMTRKRLAGAGAAIRAVSPLYGGDVGFRVYKLDSSNIRPWDPDRGDLAGTLDRYVDHIKDDRSEADILTELLLKLGLDLTVPIKTKEFSREGAKSAKKMQPGSAEQTFASFAASRDPVESPSVPREGAKSAKKMQPGSAEQTFAPFAASRDKL